MKRTSVAAALGTLATLALLPRAALAQDRSGILSPTHRTYESPQHFMFELRFGPYRPNIDSDPALNGHTPYNDVFGSPPHLMMAAELDWQAYRIPHVGTVGPGLSFGRVAIGRQAELLVPVNGQTLAQEDTNLEVLPMSLVGVFRFDMPMREYRIPLVPYIKAGVGYALWRGYNDSGTTVVNGVSAAGHTLGTMLAIGLGFNLNVLDVYTARNFDEAMGVNHTYLYAEYYSLDLNGIGQSSALRVGTSSWCTGLAFEF